MLLTSSLSNKETLFKHEVERIENNSLRNSHQLAANLKQLNMSFLEYLRENTFLLQENIFNLSELIKINNISLHNMLQRIDEFETTFS